MGKDSYLVRSVPISQYHKTTVESVFGQIKQGMGFRRYLYRGKKKVASEWNVVCAAFNLKKIAALLSATPGFVLA
jgi:Transposase DDE domain